MKKHKNMLKIVVMFVVTMMLAVMCACDETYDAEIKMNITKYDEKEGKNLEEEKNDTIQCGEKYKLCLDWNNMEALGEKLGNKEITIKVEVVIGNEKTYLSSYFVTDGGVEFEKSNEKEYTASLKIKKGQYPKLNDSYFIFGTDVVEEATEKNITESIKVKVSITEYNGKTKNIDKISFTVNGKDNEVIKTIRIQPGNYDFTESSNWYQNVSWSAKKTTVEIKVPEHCPGVKISVYKNESRKEFYGEKEFTCGEKEQKVTVVIANILKEFLSEDIYEEKLNNGGETFYLTVTAIGANGYKDTSFNVDFKLK